MFQSVSNATPSTNVTSSFIADGDCVIGFAQQYTVRVNDVIVENLSIPLVSGDKIEIEVASPAASGISYFDYTYNNVASKFAVASKSAQQTPSLRSGYRNKYWFDFEASEHLVSIKNTGAFVSDRFTWNGRSTFATHVPAIGSNWLKVSGGDLELNPAGYVKGANSTLAFWYNNAAPSSADYTVSGLLTRQNVGGAQIGLLARIDPVAKSFYSVRFPTGSSAIVSKWINGVETQLGAYPFPLSDEVSAPSFIELTVVGNSITISANGSILGQLTDSSIANAGYSGIMAASSGIIDDFVAHTSPGNDTAVNLQPASNSITSQTVIVTDPVTNSIYLVNTSGTVVASKTFTSKPISTATVFSTSDLSNHIYVLCDDGYLYRLNSSLVDTKSSTIYTGMKCIISNNVGIWLVGENQLFRLSDLNNYINIPVTGNFIYGDIVDDHLFLTTNNGQLVRVFPNGSSEVLYSATSIGRPAVLNGQVVIPVPEESKLLFYNATGPLAMTKTTDGHLPFYCNSNGGILTVTSMDSPDVMIFHGLVEDILTFTERVTFAQPLGNQIVASHYLKDTVFTNSPNPIVNGVNLPGRRAPANVKSGSGDLIIDVQYDLPLPITTVNGVTVLVDGLPNNNILNGQTLTIITDTVEGKRSLPFIIGTNVFDTVITGTTSSASATYIAAPVQPIAPEVTFSIVLPETLEPCPVTASHGNITLNGAKYDGISEVSGGDLLDVSITVPEGVESYYSMLSIADSQFALPISNNETELVDTQTGRPFADFNTVSNITIGATGTYTLPEYINAQISYPGGSALVTPVALTAGDEIEIKHVRTSAIWADQRTTILMGPINYEVVSFTMVDNIPDFIDLGTRTDAIPDFTIEAGPVIVSGLSDGYLLNINTADGLLISVNDSDYANSAFISNGDSIMATYSVSNLWTTDINITAFLEDGSEPVVGALTIVPPLPYKPNVPTDALVNNNWALYVDDGHDSIAPSSAFETEPVIKGDASTGYFVGSNSPSHDAPVPVFDKATVDLPTPASTGEFANLTMPNSLAYLVGKFSLAETSAATSMPPPLFRNTSGSNAQFTPLEISEAKIYDRVQLFKVDPMFAFEQHPVDSQVSRTFLLQHQTDGEEATPYWRLTHLIPGSKVDPHWLNEQKIQGFKVNPLWLNEQKIQGVVFDRFWLARKITPGNLFTKSAEVFVRATDNEVAKNYANFRMEEPYLFSKETLFVQSTDNRTDQTPMFVGGQDYHLSELNPVVIKDFTSDELHFDPNPKFVSELVWTPDNYLQLGGFATEADALASAMSYYPRLNIETYQQPEGTYSFTVDRNTALVCDVIPTNLYIKSWLLGGG